MKSRLLELLVCPDCTQPFEPRITNRNGEEILEAELACPGCRKAYPVLRGIPRFVDSEYYCDSFGFQWNRFRSVQLDSANGTEQSRRTFERTTGWTADECRGRLMLDAGVGAGRFAEVAVQKGAEVVGVDISSAVDAAYETLRHHPNAHVVQADLFRLPFRAGAFDLAYSIGVLHHTPDARAAFAAVAARVREGGSLAVYLYPDFVIGGRSSRWWRRATTRMPVRIVYALAALAIPLYYLYRIPLLGTLGQSLAPISMHPNRRWRWLDTFDWYTPRYQSLHSYPEVYRWFLEQGFTEIQLFDEPVRMCGRRPECKPRLTSPAE